MKKPKTPIWVCVTYPHAFNNRWKKIDVFPQCSVTREGIKEGTYTPRFTVYGHTRHLKNRTGFPFPPGIYQVYLAVERKKGRSYVLGITYP